MNLSKFNYAYSRHGLIGFLNVLIGKIGFKYRFKTPIDKIISYHCRKIENFANNKILGGIYKNTSLEINKNWSDYDASSKFLGLYELEVQKEIFNIQKNKKINKKYFVNLGAGEGFHLIGAMYAKIFKKGIAFEIDINAKQILYTNLIKNKLNKKVEILGKAENNFLENLISKKIKLKDCLFLFDIEGDEFKLLNNNNLDKLRKSILIVEIHDFYFPSKKFINNLSKKFKTKILTTENRNLSEFTFLDNMHDSEKWLLANEGRPKKMQWIVCTPK